MLSTRLLEMRMLVVMREGQNCTTPDHGTDLHLRLWKETPKSGDKIIVRL